MNEFNIGDKLLVKRVPAGSEVLDKVVTVVDETYCDRWITSEAVQFDFIKWGITNGYEFELVVEASSTGNTKYNREIKPGVFVDVYDVLYAFKVTDPCLQHLIKKALAAGQRGHKDARQDLVDIRDSAQRALESYDLWSPHNED